MKRSLLLLVLLSPLSAHAQQAVADLEKAKQACMRHGLNKQPAGRHPELSAGYPGGWETGFESCEQVWREWKKRYDAAADVAKAEHVEMQKGRGRDDDRFRRSVDRRRTDDKDRIDTFLNRRR